jgi:amino acid transporter
MILVYSAGNLGVFRLYWREHRSEFNIFLHVICPLLSTIALVAVAYYSNVPLPSGAVGWVPFVVAAWLIIGIGVVWWLSRTGKEEEMERSMQNALEL